MAVRRSKEQFRAGLCFSQSHVPLRIWHVLQNGSGQDGPCPVVNDNVERQIRVGIGVGRRRNPHASQPPTFGAWLLLEKSALVEGGRGARDVAPRVGNLEGNLDRMAHFWCLSCIKKGHPLTGSHALESSSVIKPGSK